MRAPALSLRGSAPESDSFAAYLASSKMRKDEVKGYFQDQVTLQDDVRAGVGGTVRAGCGGRGQGGC